MEFLNRIELRGIIGRISNLTIGSGPKILHRLSVVTEYSYINNLGEPCIEMTWFYVEAAQGEKVNIPDSAKRGDWIRIVGRIRVASFVDSNNEPRHRFDVVASEAEILPKEN